MKELKKFQSSTFDTIARRRLVEDQDTILELTGKKQELQNEINCMFEWFKIFSRCWISNAVDNPTLPVNLFPTSSISWRNVKPLCRNAEPQRRAAKHLGHMVFREKFFANPTASSSAPYPQELNPWISHVSEHTLPHVMSESQTPVQDQKFQSGPSARNSVIPFEGDSSKNYRVDKQRLQISDHHFDKYPHQQRLLVGR